MASQPSVFEINRAFRNRIIFGCIAVLLITWILVAEQVEWMFYLFDRIPGKLFLFFVLSVNVALAGLIIYAYFYIPPLKGFLVRLAGSCFTLAIISISCAVWGIPDLQKIEFSATQVLIHFYQGREPGPFLSLTSVCVIGLLVTGFYYMVADLIDALRTRE